MCHIGRLGKPLLYLSSYAPLFALLAIRFQSPGLVWFCAVLAVVGTAALLLLLRLNARAVAGAHQVKEIRDTGAEASAYLASYLLPFLTVSTPTIRDLIAYVGFLGISATIYLRSPVVQINPLLYVLGYRVLEVVDTNGLRAYLVTNRRPDLGQRIAATRFRDDVLIDRSSRFAATRLDRYQN